MSLKHAIYNWLVYPHRLAFVRPYLPGGRVRVLDVGCGNHSPRITKRYLPDCVYHGLQKSRWNLDEGDDRSIDRLYEVDLDDRSGPDTVPDAAYDAVICSHVLEHLRAPGRALALLARKVAPGGVLYVETPTARSLRLPRAENGWMGFRGCLNFRDDETHVKPVDPRTVVEVLRGAGLGVRGPAPRWMWRRVLLLPFYCAGCLATKGFVPASVLWDVTGFACYVIGIKPQNENA